MRASANLTWTRFNIQRPVLYTAFQSLDWNVQGGFKIRDYVKQKQEALPCLLFGFWAVCNADAGFKSHQIKQTYFSKYENIIYYLHVKRFNVNQSEAQTSTSTERAMTPDLKSDLIIKRKFQRKRKNI